MMIISTKAIFGALVDDGFLVGCGDVTLEISMPMSHAQSSGKPRPFPDPNEGCNSYQFKPKAAIALMTRWLSRL
jgi:hypothetical protein